MNPTFAKWTRKLHRCATVLIVVPLLVVICSGLLLQLKKHVSWIQPPTADGAGGDPTIGFEAILAAARSVPEAGIRTWDDVDRLDVRPGNGIVKVQPKASRYEVQVDTATGEVVQVAYRRSDLIEQIHDGSSFSAAAKLGVFLPTGALLLFLWVTGLVLWWLPHGAKRAARCRAEAAAAREAA